MRQHIAIIGSGFAGSLLAMVIHRLGYRVTLLERGKHPRFAIGESTTPLMNLLIEELAIKYDLPRLLPLTTYGAWKSHYPHVVCGKKRGFTYYHHQAGERFQARPDRADQLLVAASPHDIIADTHWLRADVDSFLVQEVIAIGVDYQEDACLTELEVRAGGVTLRGEQKGRAFQCEADFVFDASGARGFLAQALHLPESSFPGYPNPQALFSHFVDVGRCDTLPDFQTSETPPYSPDDAALHHVYDGGWMWVLRFDNGVTSAGFTATEPLATELNLADKEGAWQRFLERFPSVKSQFESAEPILPLIYQRQMTYRCETLVGDRWAMLPSASAFIDPLFSTGMPLALLGIERIGKMLEVHGLSPTLRPALDEYAETTKAESLGAAQLVSACYSAFSQFAPFVDLTMFYFAAASYSEMARRAEKRHLVKRFLALDRADFAPALFQVLERVQREKRGEADFSAEVARAIEPLNIAGLADTTKRNWYGVDFEDTIRTADRLQSTPEAMRHLFATAPWAQIPTPPEMSFLSKIP